MNRAGFWGENKACEYLIKQGYTILKRNFRCVLDGKIAGEIDIVAQINDVVVFVEVKTRKSAVFGTGAEAVDFRKKEKLKKAARLFDPEEKQVWRFDVIDILYTKTTDDKMAVKAFQHFENAF